MSAICLFSNGSSEVAVPAFDFDFLFAVALCLQLSFAADDFYFYLMVFGLHFLDLVVGLSGERHGSSESEGRYDCEN